jgi:restriction system protein
MTKKTALPTVADLYKPTLDVLKALGGSGSPTEIDDGVIALIGATQEQQSATYPKSGAAVLPDRIAWARSFLKYPGFASNEMRGVWVLTEKGRLADTKSGEELKKIVNAAYNAAYKASVAAKNAAQGSTEGGVDHEPSEGSPEWSYQLLKRVQALDPAAFERLCQRLLRLNGFTRVEVTGKPGDHGIDGVGVLRMNLVSFQVVFQCKRWKGSVGSMEVRNFRGSMQGRADKGLIITTGTFTTEARKEATRDGAPAIDLIDGEAFCDLLKDRELGVRIEIVKEEKVTIDEAFFLTI